MELYPPSCAGHMQTVRCIFSIGGLTVKARSRKNARPASHGFMVVRSDGSMRAVGRQSTGRRRQEVAFPVIIEFARGSSTPRVESLTAMHAVAAWLAKNATERVTVVGHANLRGLDEPAASLARARVSAVANFLVLLGATRDQLVALRSTRLHSVQIGPTLGERRRRRVVVIFRHEPPQAAQRKVVRKVAGASARSDESRREVG